MDSPHRRFTNPADKLDDLVDRIVEQVSARTTLLRQLRVLTTWRSGALLAKLPVLRLVVHGDSGWRTSASNSRSVRHLL